VVSSTSSCAPVHPLTETAAVEQALIVVAERSFFAFAEPADPSLPMTLASAEVPALTAAVRFSGPSTGEMRVTTPVALTRELAQAFSGDPSLEFGDADLADMAGEFANMITGAWLTAVDTRVVFDLGAPVVTRIDTAPETSLLMQINCQPVGLAWHVD
jgi:CheY-specific phosphatase CheX